MRLLAKPAARVLLVGTLSLLPSLGAEDGLVERNPFGKEPPAPPPPNIQRPPQPQAPLTAQFEWIGYYEQQGTPRFGFRDLRTGQSFWLRQGENHEGLTVIANDFGRRQVTLRNGGMTGILDFKVPNYAAGAAPVRVPGGNPVANANPAPAPAANTVGLPEQLAQAAQQQRQQQANQPPQRRRIVIPRRTASGNN